jgi:uncharacterized membrane protein
VAPRPDRSWLVPALLLLLLLALVPSVAGVARVAELMQGGVVTAANARFHQMPLPVLLHIGTAVPFALLGTFQFAPAFRRRMPRWHRIVGRMLVPFALIVAVSGLWMTLRYPWPVGDGVVLAAMRLLAGTAMLFEVLLGVRALARRRYADHGAWMTRAYALGMGAGTQVLTHLPWFLLVGQPTEGPRAVMMGLGWLINVVVAERVVQGESRVGAPTANRFP